MQPDCERPRAGSPSSVKGIVLDAADTVDVRRQKMARIILDSMYQFLGLLDVEGTVLEINRAALDGAGLCLEQVLGKPFWQARWWAVSEEVRNRVQAMIAEARSGRFVRCDFEVFGELHGYKTIVIDFSLTPIMDDRGGVAFLLPEGRNISEKIAISAELTRKNGELQNALEKLKEIDGFKTKFFANVSHELRTPLTGIVSSAQLIAAEHHDPSILERVTAILDLSAALDGEIKQLLDLSKMQAGTGQSEMTTFRLDAVTRHRCCDKHNERARGTADLHVGAPECRDQEPGDDGGDQALLGLQAAGDREGHGQRQRQHADRDAG